MSPADIAELADHWASALADAATTIAFIVAGLWTWRLFVKRRDRYAKVDLTVGLEFLGHHPATDQIVVQVIANLANAGTVRHTIASIEYSLRVLKDDDPLLADEKLLGQIRFPHRLVKDRPFFPADWHGSFVDPGVTNSYRSVTAIPVNARLVLASARFAYQDQQSDFHKSERVFLVPPEMRSAPS